MTPQLRSSLKGDTLTKIQPKEKDVESSEKPSPQPKDDPPTKIQPKGDTPTKIQPKGDTPSEIQPQA